MTTKTLNDLEQKIDRLIHFCSILQKENDNLKMEKMTWEAEREAQRSHQARTKTQLEGLLAKLDNLSHLEV